MSDNKDTERKPKPSRADVAVKKDPKMEALMAEWSAEQEKIAAQVVVDDAAAGFAMPDFGLDDESGAAATADPKIAVPPKIADSGLPPLRYVGGVDISFVKGTSAAVASLTILSYPDMKVLHNAMRSCEMDIPYVPGYLAFREVPALLPLFEEVKKTMPDIMPQLLVVDGNGVHHYRRCGFASHLGVLLDIPTIGAAKKFLALDGMSREGMEAECKAFWAKKQGPLMPIHGKSGQFWGYAALTGGASSKALYISPGHRVSFQAAARLVMSMCKHHVPEPTRQADLQSRDYIRKHFTEVVAAVGGGKKK